MQTDHQPLETIVKKPLENAPRKLQRMMLQPQHNSFEVMYKGGKELYIAHTLSRASLEKIGSLELETDVVFRVELSKLNLKPTMMSHAFFKKYRKDPTLKQLVEVVRSGWPVDKSMLSLCLRPFWSFEEEIRSISARKKELHGYG